MVGFTQYLPGLLNAVQIKGDTSCGFSAKAKATQPPSLQPHIEVEEKQKNISQYLY